VTRRLALAIGLVFAIIATQAPEFAQQYRQRLGGALDELHRIIARFDAETAAEALSREQGLARLEQNDDPLARERGEAIASDIERSEKLERQQQDFAQAGSFARLTALARDYDPTMFSRAFAAFEPAVPTSIEGLTAGALGLAFGWAATHIVAWPIRRRFSARRDEERRA
jgi:hypothetical protein